MFLGNCKGRLQRVLRKARRCFEQVVRIQIYLDRIAAKKYFYKQTRLAHRYLGLSLYNLILGITTQVLHDAIKQSVSIPEGFQVHPRLSKMHIDSRLRSIESSKIDWATAEAAAFYSLLKEGKRVRLVGQDVGRGTFSHRHAILYDQSTNQSHIPLSNPNSLEIVDSPLSELSVLGFEYGQSISDQDKL